MDRLSRRTGAPAGRLQWLALTVPLAPLALFAYGAFEWLFFLTKPSSVSVLPWSERLLVLLLVTMPYMHVVLLAQVAMSVLALVVFPRLRVLALVPASAILAALVLILADNFFSALFRVFPVSGASIGRPLYGAILVGAFLLWLWKLTTDLGTVGSPARVSAVLWLCAVPLLVVAGRELAVPVTGPPSLPRIGARDQKNVLVISIDGVNAAALSAYGAGARTSPFLASIAGDSLFCENAFSNAAQTYGSLASLLTGRSPLTTQVIVPPSRLRGGDAWLHLPGILRRSGYRTLQLSMRHFADAEDANLLGGFERANYRWETPLLTGPAAGSLDAARTFRLTAIERLDSRLVRITGSRAVPNDFAHVTGRTVDPFWTDARRIRTLLATIDETDGPWFAHLHLLDTHAGGQLEEQKPRRTAHDYEQALLNADRHVALIFEALVRRKALDTTVVVITSDHGAGWMTTDRIPLLIRFPHGEHRRRVATNVSNLDIAPTLLDALGVAPPSWMEGASLLRVGADDPGRAVVAVADSGTPPARGLSIAVPRAPNHGARALSVITGSSWFRLDLASGELSSGAVSGHTRPAPAVTRAQARTLLEQAARRNGFEVANPDAALRGSTARARLIASPDVHGPEPGARVRSPRGVRLAPKDLSASATSRATLALRTQAASHPARYVPPRNPWSAPR